MRRNIGLVVAWILATLLAVAVASAAVAGIRDEVIDRPASVDAPPEALAADEPAMPEESPTTVPAASTSTTLEAHETTTTTNGTTSTTQPVPTSSTTAPPSAEYSKTFDTIGGSVRIRVIGDSVEFAGAYPAPGWKVELENAGPEKVEVHFERDGEDAEDEEDEIEFKAWMDDGELRVDISTE